MLAMNFYGEVGFSDHWIKMSPWWRIVWTLVDSTPCQIFCAVDLWFKITTDQLTINLWSLTFDWSLMLNSSCKIFGLTAQKSEKVSGIKKAWSPNILSIIWYILPGSNNCNLYYYLYRGQNTFCETSNIHSHYNAADRLSVIVPMEVPKTLIKYHVEIFWHFISTLDIFAKNSD